MRIRTQFGNIIRPCLSPVVHRLIFGALFIVLGSHGDSFGQGWRIPTPRDTVSVPANQKTFVTSKIQLNAGGVDMWVSPSLTFTENDGTTTFGSDGAYTFQVDGTPLIPQAQNPPLYGGKQYKYALTVTTVPGLPEVPFLSLENAYQQNHVYTAHIPSQGQKFQFRIRADKDADYPRATGSVLLNLARWTAGIAVEYVSLDFGTVQIGTSKPLLDSIASYGLDALQIDSISIVEPAPGTGDYTFQSEHGPRFTFQQTETTNEIKVNFSPSVRGQINAELHIYSHNADPVSRITIVKLLGKGIAPDFGVGPPQIDFGKVRIGYPKPGFTQISNSKGNTDLNINTSTHYDQYQPAPPPVAFAFSPQTVLPSHVTAGSIGQIRTIFSPTQRVKYQGVLQVRGDNVPADSVQLTGEGAAPVPVLAPQKNGMLDFGLVYNGNTSQRTITLTNQGNWTASVILVRISGTFRSVFTFSPVDTEFNLEPDSSRIFTVFFHPGTGLDTLHIVCYFELVYDDNTIDTIRLIGTEIEPELHISPLFHSFGKVKVGASKTDTVSYLNTTASTFLPVFLQEEDVRPGLFFKEVGKIGNVNPGIPVPLVVKFTPLLSGPATAWAYITANGKADSVQLSGIGAIAKAIFNPSPVNYGIVPSNHPDTLYTTLRDSGNYPLIIDSIKIDGPAANDFSILWQPIGKTPYPLPDTVNPDSTITIEVRFLTNALTGEVHQATLCVYYDDGTKDCIPLEAIEEAQYLQFAQSSVDFGKHRIKTRSDTSAVFRNGSNKTLSVGAVTATSATNVFSVLDTLLPVGAQLNESVKVQFFPQVRGMYSGYLHAFGGDIKTDSIQLRGQGAAPLPDFSTDTVDFGIVLLNASKQSSFELLDTGDWDLTAIKIELTGKNSGEFTYQKKGGQVAQSADTIPETKYSTYNVWFTPTKTTVFHTANIVFTFDDSTQRIVKLVGYDESPTLVLDQDSVDFGKIRIGTLPGVDIVHIVSTSPNTLTAQNLNLTTAAPANTFTAMPSSGPITLTPQTIYTLFPIAITFVPQVIGVFNAQFTISGKDVKDSSYTTYITGIGAAPIAQLSDTTIDFGLLFPGYKDFRSFTLKDAGNWFLSVIKVDITGPNKGDFSLRNIPQQFMLLEDSSSLFTVDFTATPPYQAAQRTAQLVFTLDDSSKFTVQLIEQDIEPIKVDLRVDNLRARIGDNVYPCLRLITDLPDSLKIRDLKGVITYDSTLFDLDRTGIAAGVMLQQLGNWKLIVNSADLPGIFTYELQGTSAPLSKAGALLRMKFRPHDNDAPGSVSPLLQSPKFSFPLRTELNPLVTDGTLVVDSTCGDPNLASGVVTANMVDQNTPNPFGAKTANNQTLIPFDIGYDNTQVTIRILDISGREVARPVDNVLFNQGRYTTKVDASMLGSSGAYFYEFRAGNGTPVLKKMMVGK